MTAGQEQDANPDAERGKNELSACFHRVEMLFQTRVRRGRSAGFQPAVSPTSSRQRTRETDNGGSSRRVRVGNPRADRLKVCATIWRRSVRVLMFCRLLVGRPVFVRVTRTASSQRKADHKNGQDSEGTE